MSDAEKDKIFDRFHRVLDNQQGANEQAGSGLGLAIVKEIAHLHGASISIADSAQESVEPLTKPSKRGLKVTLRFKRLTT